MEKQYVLNEQEFLSLCNKIETIGVDIAFINRKLSIDDKENLKSVFISVEDKLNYLKQTLGWM